MKKNDCDNNIMERVILSICIPTYFRAEVLNKTLNHIISFPSKEIEIIVSDNASPDNTETLLKSIKDPRLKYNRNKENLGYDLNLLKCVEMANGKFLFFISDDDIIEFKEIPWILETIKKNNSITQILGSVGDKRYGHNKIYQKCEDKELSSGEESLSKLSFRKFYLGGTILKRESLDINQAEKYIGFNYIHLVLIIHAMISGNTLCTSRILCYIPENPPSTKAVMLKGYSKGLPYNHPLSRISQLEYRSQIINELIRKFPSAYKKLLNHEKKYASSLFMDFLFNDPIYFFKLLFCKSKFSNSLKFWLYFIVRFLCKLGLQIGKKISIIKNYKTKK